MSSGSATSSRDSKTDGNQEAGAIDVTQALPDPGPARGLMRHLNEDMARLFSTTDATGEDISSTHTASAPATVDDPTKSGTWIDSEPKRLQPDRRIEICSLLNQTLADCLDLERRATQARWNITGPEAAALKPLFDDIAVAARQASERIAKRVTQLNGIAEATVWAAAGRLGFSEYPLNTTQCDTHVAAVSATLAVIMAALCEDVDTLLVYDDALSQRLIADMLLNVRRQLAQISETATS